MGVHKTFWQNTTISRIKNLWQNTTISRIKNLWQEKSILNGNTKFQAELENFCRRKAEYCLQKTCLIKNILPKEKLLFITILYCFLYIFYNPQWCVPPLSLLSIEKSFKKCKQIYSVLLASDPVERIFSYIFMQIFCSSQ